MATQQTETPQAVSQMVDAAKAFVGSLNEQQKAKATFEYMDGERIFWYYPPMNRHGLPLRDMGPTQRELAIAVMASGLTPESYEQAKLIIEHEDVLGPLEKERAQLQKQIRALEKKIDRLLAEATRKRPASFMGQAEAGPRSRAPLRCQFERTYQYK